MDASQGARRWRSVHKPWEVAHRRTCRWRLVESPAWVTGSRSQGSSSSCSLRSPRRGPRPPLPPPPPPPRSGGPAGRARSQPARGARPRRRAAGPPRPPLRLPGAGRHGREGGPGLPREGALRRAGRRRVRPRAGRDSDHPGRLAPLRRAVSAEPVLRPEVARLSELVAARYAGTRSDVLRLAVPPRHAAAESEPSPPAPDWRRRASRGPVLAPLPRRRRAGDRPARGIGAARGVDRLPGGRLGHRAGPRRRGHAAPVAGAACSASPTTATWRGSTPRSPRCSDPAGTSCSPPTSAPAERYRSFLAVARGEVKVVAGTRAAGFAPVHDLGLVALWDDGDDLYAEPRAPYPHTREVLLLRAHDSGCAALLGGFAAASRRRRWSRAAGRGTWPRPATPSARAAPRSASPAPPTASSSGTPRPGRRGCRAAPTSRSARLWRTVPVLVQTPRRGYAEALVCDTCREPARCPVCTGPLHLPEPHLPPRCRWCAADAPRAHLPGLRWAGPPGAGGR